MLSRDEQRKAFKAGAKEMLSPILGIAAWGLVTGVAIAQSTLTTWQAVVFCVLSFAGSAQLAALPLIVAFAPISIAVLTALVVNLRFVIYSAALARPLAHLTFRHRLWLSYLVGDVPFALYTRRFSHEPQSPIRVAYLTGIVVTNYLGWQTSILVGLALGASVPREWGLELAGTLALLAILIPMIERNRHTAVGVLVTAVVAVPSNVLPLHLGVLVSIACGVVAALLSDTWSFRGHRASV